MVALQWTPCPCTSLDRFLMCHPEAVARRSRGVNEWLETWGRYMKTECVFMVTGWDENSCIMLSAAFAVWLPCFLSKIPWSAFCLLLSFSLVFLLAVSQRWLRLNFAICVKKKKCASWYILCWSQLWLLWGSLVEWGGGGGDDVRSVSSLVFVLCPWGMLDQCNSFLWASGLVLASNIQMAEEWEAWRNCRAFTYTTRMLQSHLFQAANITLSESYCVGMFFWTLSTFTVQSVF